MSQKTNERVGSTRRIYPVEKGVIAFEYSDSFSVFDRGASKQGIPGLGTARCACAVRSFQIVRAHGLWTHFVRQYDERTIHVQEFGIPGHEPLSGKLHGHVLPVEWLYRNFLEGSLWGRVGRGEVDLEKLGLKPGTVPKKGMKFPSLYQECTTKFERLDRHLSDEEVRKLAGLSGSEWIDARHLVQSSVRHITEAFRKVGFACRDGKIELGMTDNREMVLVDVFGTPDENRITKAKSGRKHDKDLIRNHFIESGWKAELDAAKSAYPNDDSNWPHYPELPERFMSKVSRRYCQVAHDYGGVDIKV